MMTKTANVPMIHRNGTTAQGLLDEMMPALIAIQNAIEALQHASPNQRDYYPMGEQAWRDALQAHCNRIETLKNVAHEYEMIAEGIADQL